MKYIYCDSHGAVHVQTDADPEVWCTAARDAGLEMYYVAHMQNYGNWTNDVALDFARRECKRLGLWLYNPRKENHGITSAKR